ncbi:hypothetical protein BVC93_07100 [Mycobacterium sp. MS1601]|uniref:hypothetical protein n=1 Tax=Mycobacterium sp. MS1601 TaxID=1936029 RepID=UPI0009796D66|nr:hypothetical protein [Mycobacterium sp. MS1601]AQA02236.1 hypothetical protein BVC93_07100 [Mycobacterium sp. MS1601]
MPSPRPGWLVTLCAIILAVSVWLPWITTSADGGGRANAVGGSVGSVQLSSGFGAGQLIALLASTLLVAGAMAARGFSPRTAAAAALTISVLIAALTAAYYRLHVAAPIVAAYGLYIGAGAAAAAVACSVWAVVDSLLKARRVAR